MQPDNPIVGGITLRIPAIRSPDYVAGVSGWTINVDGTAEFNNVTVRGTFIATGSNGSFVELHSVGNTAEIAIEPGGGNVNAATIKGGVAGGGQPELIITSPQQTLTSPNSTANIIVQGANATLPASFVGINADSLQFEGLAGTSGVGAAVLNMGNNQGSPAGVNLGIVGGSSIGIDGGGFSVANDITLSTGTVDILAATITYNLKAQPMGLNARVDSSANSAAVGAETVVMTLVKPTIKTGRAYEFRIEHTIATSVPTVTTMRVRENSAVGAVISDRFRVSSDTNFNSMYLDMGKIKNITGTDDNSKDAVFTIQAAAGTTQQVASATRWRSFELWDIGAASDFPNATPW